MDDLFRRTDDGDPDGDGPVDTAALSAIFAEVVAERVAQDGKWGGPEHDDQHNEYDWLDFISERIGKIQPFDTSPAGLAQYRRRLVQTAALAVAGIQSLDRRQARGEVA